MRELDQQLLARQLAISRRSIPSHQWSAIAASIAADRAQWEKHLRKPEPEINRKLFAGLEILKATGVLVPQLTFDRRKVADIRRYLDPLPVYRGSHILSSDYRQAPFDEVQRDSAFAGYTADQILRAPHLVDFFNQPAIVDFMEAALGCVPTLYSVNGWWSFPATIPTGDGMQRFHRDTDDWRFITLFVYLTDVDEGAGPHQLVAGSHTLAGMTRLIERARAGATSGEKMIDPAESFTGDYYFQPEFSAFIDRHFRDSIVNVTGPAGTVFMANTIAVHRGIMPSKMPRLIVWARYGLGPNTNSVDLEQGPLARLLTNTQLTDTPRNRYVNRLLFEFDRISSALPELALAAPAQLPQSGPSLADDAAFDEPVPLPVIRPADERSAAAALRLQAQRGGTAPAKAKPGLVAAGFNWARSLIPR